LLLGLLLLQIGVLGAQYGRDGDTSGVLVWALLLVDVGGSVSMVPTSMAWHLFDMPTVVAAALGILSTLSPMLIILISALRHWTGASLSSTIWVWFGCIVVALACQVWLTPTNSERKAEAVRVLGTALQSEGHPTVWKVLIDLYLVSTRYLSLNVLAVFTMTGFMTMNNIYQGLLGDWCMMIFGSTAAGERLGSIFSMARSISGAVFAPLLAYVADKLGLGTTSFYAIAIVFSFISVVTIGITTWFAQIVTAICMSLSYAIFVVLQMRMLLALVGQELFGSARGTSSLIAMPIGLALQALTYDLISQFPDTDLIHLRLPFQLIILYSAICTASWSAHVLYTGLPARPVIYDKDGNGDAASLAEGLTGKVGG